MNKSARHANAKMGRHQIRHSRHHHFHMAKHRVHKSPEVAAKHLAHPAKRG